MPDSDTHKRLMRILEMKGLGADESSTGPCGMNTAPLTGNTVELLKEIALRATQSIYSYDDLADIVVHSNKTLLRKVFGADRLLLNYVINCWEYATGAVCLESYPWNITIPVSESCNAACHFCHSYANKLEQSLYDPAKLDLISEALSCAMCMGFVGYGEPLIHPDFGLIVEKSRRLAPQECVFYTVTNGMLLDKYIDLFVNNRFSNIAVSLNAANAYKHNLLMGLGENAFDKIIASIKRIKSSSSITFYLSYVVVNQNIEDIPDFIKLAEELGASKVIFRTLGQRDYMDERGSYHLLPPYLHPNFDFHYKRAVEAINTASIIIEAVPEIWSFPIFPAAIEEKLRSSGTIEALGKRPEKYTENLSSSYRGTGKKLATSPESQPVENIENPYKRRAPLRCQYPYANFNISNLDNLVTPCCYMPDVPGFEHMIYDGSVGFLEVWNSPAYQELRRGLFAGPLFGNCLTCLK